MSDIIVSFKAKGHKRLIEAIKKLELAQKGASNANDKYNKSGNGALKTNRLLGGSFATFRSHLLLYNFAMGLGIKQTVEFAKQAAKVQDMSRAFTTLSGTGESAALSVSKISNAVKGTMSQMDLFKQANNAMILGVTRNTDEMAEMFQIAQTLGAALGVDTPQAVESLITGIGRQSRLMLDNIGIIVKADEAYKAYADRLGTTVDKLTDAEKKQAFFTAAMESARTKAAELGNQQLTARDQFNKFNATISDFTNFIGEKTTPIVLSFFNSFGESLKRITETDLETTIRQLEGLGVSAENLAKLNRLLGMEQAREQIKKSQISISRSLEQLIPLTSIKAIEDFGAAVDILKFEGVQSPLDEIIVIDPKNLNFDAIQTEFDRILAMADQFSEGLAEADAPDKQAQFRERIEHFTQLAVKYQAILSENDKLIIANQTLAGTNEEVTETNNERANSTNILTNALNNAFIAANKKVEALKEELELNKQLLQSSAALGKSYKNAGKAAVAAARAAVSAKIQEAVMQYMAEAMTKIPFPASLGVPILGAAMAGALGSVLSGSSSNIGSISAPRYAEGGYVGGRPHSQGGTIIEAERGEFVMSRNATESIGLETLNQMNQQGGAGNINISVTGNVLTQDFVEGELAESIKEAVRRGSDFGLS